MLPKIPEMILRTALEYNIIMYSLRFSSLDWIQSGGHAPLPDDRSGA